MKMNKEKKGNKQKLGGLVIILLILLTVKFNNIVTDTNNSCDIKRKQFFPFLSLTSHEPITITNDGNFTDYGFPGSGTLDDPYVIEDFNITTSSDKGIYITGTTKYFIIQNCFIHAYSRGIHINNVAAYTATIFNNTCILHENIGIYIQSARYSNITENECISNYIGISVDSSEKTIIQYNFVQDGYFGIKVGTSQNSVINNNTCVITMDYRFNFQPGGLIFTDSDNCLIQNNYLKARNTKKGQTHYGIEIKGFNISVFNNIFDSDGYILRGIDVNNADQAKIINNTLDQISEGIFVFGSMYATIVNNSINAFSTFIQFMSYVHHFTEESPLDMYLSHTVENNTKNGSPILYFKNLIGEKITEGTYGQLFFINCSDLLIENINMNDGRLKLVSCNNITMRNSNFVGGNYFVVISSTNYSTFVNNVLRKSDENIIYFIDSHYNIVENNTIAEGYDSCYLRNSDNNIIKDNTFFMDHNSIWLYSSENVTILNNYCEADEAAYSYTSVIIIENSAKLNITGNTCIYSNNSVKIVSSDNITLFNNTFRESKEDGTFIDQSTNILLSSNLFNRSLEYAIYLTSTTENCTIYGNSFHSNNLKGTSQAYDEGINNIWYNSSILQGNWWSDWNGIGDYSIDGSANSYDLYPIDFPPNFETTPDDYLYEEGTTGHNLTWVVTDFNPDYYWIYVNETVAQEGSWDSGEPITISIDGLTAGTYNYTIKAMDLSKK
ncbi:MAG: NosD domain-containing protein, partial [Candidatus Heimdallarchaeaceae archaeon]